MKELNHWLSNMNTPIIVTYRSIEIEIISITTISCVFQWAGIWKYNVGKALRCFGLPKFKINKKGYVCKTPAFLPEPLLPMKAVRGVNKGILSCEDFS